MNHIQVEGRLGRDVEIKETKGGLKIYNFNLATTIRQSGNDETLWYKVSFFSGRYDKMIECLKKGSAVSVIGTLQIPRVYEAKDGSWKCSLEVRGDMLSFCIGADKKESSQSFGNNDNQMAQGQAKAEVNFEDLPF